MSSDDCLRLGWTTRNAASMAVAKFNSSSAELFGDRYLRTMTAMEDAWSNSYRLSMTAIPRWLPGEFMQRRCHGIDRVAIEAASTMLIPVPFNSAAARTASMASAAGIMLPRMPAACWDFTLAENFLAADSVVKNFLTRLPDAVIDGPMDTIHPFSVSVGLNVFARPIGCHNCHYCHLKSTLECF